MNNSIKMSNTAKSTEGASKQAGSSSNVVKNSTIRLNEKQVRNLCISLSQAESEVEVIKLLTKVGYWDNLNAWRHYGDVENNFSIINNQQSQAEAALVEKITNSVDSVLISSVRQAGINPEGDRAPKSIREATAEVIGIPEGNLACLAQKDLAKLSEKIQLIVTGERSSPNYTIFDSGEGQSATTMPYTILSLSKSNKFRIPFVQGKFNMGGSGALQFCGEHGLQVIITKRNPELAKEDNDPNSGSWAFTVLRRFPPTGNEKSSSYRYLAPNHQQVLQFKADTLPLVPSKGSNPKPYAESVVNGTFIKLFDYRVSAGNKTLAVLDLNYRLATLIPELPLPVKVVECRPGYKGHTLYATLKGLKTRLESDGNKNVVSGFPSSSTIIVDGDKLDVSIIAFKPGTDMKRWRSDEGIIFTVNGQKQGSLDFRFFTREAVQKNYLKSNLLLLVDCSGIKQISHENLFMASRDRMRSGELLNSIEKELEKLVKNHKGLRKLNEEYRQARIKQNLADSKPMADILQNVINKVPTIASILGLGTKLSNPSKVKGSGIGGKFVGKRYPTFFSMVKDYTFKSPKGCPKNQTKFRVQIKTDVQNDYFSRSVDKGSIKVKLGGTLVKESVDFEANLYEGLLTFNCHTPKGCKVGSIYHYEIEILDRTQSDPFKCEFYVRIEPDQPKSSKVSGGRRKPSNKKKGNGNWDNSQLCLPNPTPVTRSEWKDYEGFNDHTALKVIGNSKGGYDYFINDDNVHLLREQKHNRKVDPEIQYTRYQVIMTLIGLSCIKSYKDRVDAGNKPDRSAEAMVEETTRLAASIILGVIDPLAGLDK